MLTRDQWLSRMAAAAVRAEAEFGVPAEMAVAQSAIESRWGEKPVGQANYFGIKRAARHTKGASTKTREFIDGKWIEPTLDFADYESLEESVRDYAWLISHGRPYRDAWDRYQATRNARSLALGVARVYATAPEYAELVLRIMDQDNVRQAVAAARAANETGVSNAPRTQ